MRVLNIPFQLICRVATLVACLWVLSVQAGSDHGFTVLGPENVAVLRWVTSSTQCPTVVWYSGRQQALQVRAAKAVLPVREDAAQSDTKASDFQLTSCEIAWPKNEVSATVNGQTFLAPKSSFHRILLMGDTGCRLKASEHAFQDCSNPNDWLYARNVQNAAALQPDLVVHLGDIHYRESPCPATLGCRDSVWGYGSDAWEADFFEPSSPLLKAAPWVFVRGNHEACNRAGQGWFRFLDPNPFNPRGSCDHVEDDDRSNFTPPYRVHINPALSFIVFDSAALAGKKMKPDAAGYQAYVRYLDWVNQVTRGGGRYAFLSHHPVYGMAYAKSDQPPLSGGNVNLANWFAERSPDVLAPDNTQWLMHGHIHTFEAMGYDHKPFSSFILGNSGSQIEGVIPPSVPAGFKVAPGLTLSTYFSSPTYGFAILDIDDRLPVATYQLTEYNDAGVAILRCDLTHAPVTCQRLAAQGTVMSTR